MTLLHIIDNIDNVVLQDALSAIAAWADEWQLSVSIDVVYCMLVKACVLLLNSVNSMILLYP